MTPSEAWTEPRRTHPASPWLDLPSMVRTGVGLVVLAAAFGEPRLVAVAVGYLVLANLVTWLRRTWSFDGETLTLDDGVLHRTYRRVPVRRVQQVEVTEGVLHRVLGLAVVRVETAGAAGQAEVVLDALPAAEARRLRAAVLEARASALAGTLAPPAGTEPEGSSDRPVDGPIPPPPPPPAPEVAVLRLPPARLMLAGVTSSNLLVVFVVLGTFLDVVSRLPRNVAEEVEDQAGTLLATLGLLAGVAGLLALALLAAALSSLATHYDLTVVRSGDELRLRRGLFERREAVVPLRRVQAVSIRQNPVQRLVGMASVRVRSAGTGVGGDTRLLVPLASRAEVAALLRTALDRDVELDELDAAPRAARTRRIVRRLPPVAVVAAPAVLLGPPLAAAVAIVGGALVLAVLLGFDAYRGLGHRLEPGLVVTRWGSLLRRTVVVSTVKVQSVRVTASPFQRLRGLATLRFDLAGQGLTPLVQDQGRQRCEAVARAVRLDGAPDPVPLVLHGAEGGTRQWTTVHPHRPHEDP